jgi:hypothetical protein
MDAIVERPHLGVLARFVIAVGAAGMLISIGVAVLLFMSSEAEDILRAYPSPEMHEHVREFALPAAAIESKSGSESKLADFDGDGTGDELALDYFHMEPLFSRTTSAMVSVVSGRTHEPLLVHAVGCPLCVAKWCGDIDGNGTIDLGICDDGRWLALGYQRGP